MCMRVSYVFYAIIQNGYMLSLNDTRCWLWLWQSDIHMILVSLSIILMGAYRHKLNFIRNFESFMLNIGVFITRPSHVDKRSQGCFSRQFLLIRVLSCHLIDFIDKWWIWNWFVFFAARILFWVKHARAYFHVWLVGVTIKIFCEHFIRHIDDFFKAIWSM